MAKVRRSQSGITILQLLALTMLSAFVLVCWRYSGEFLRRQSLQEVPIESRAEHRPQHSPQLSP